MRKSFAWILLEIFVLTACAPMTKFIPTIIPSPTLESISQGWSTFHNENFGFSFQYPAAYDKGFQSFEFTCNFIVQRDKNKLHVVVGDVQIFSEKTNKKLLDYVKYYIDNNRQGWQVKQSEIDLASLIAQRLEYHQEKPPRGGNVTIVVNKDKAIIIQYFDANFMDCGLKDDGYSSYWVYQRILQSLKLRT